MNQTRREYERRKQQIREEAGQRQHSLVEENKQLQKDLSSKRQQEEGLMKEMEIMGQAFEDLQEQNLRLLDQLKGVCSLYVQCSNSLGGTIRNPVSSCCQTCSYHAMYQLIRRNYKEPSQFLLSDMLFSCNVSTH